MEEIKLPTVPELSLIPIERRNFPEADHKAGENERSSAKKERDNAARGLVTVNSRQHDVKRGDGCDHLHLAGRPNLRR